MQDKPKRGRPPKAEGEKRRNTINVRLDDVAHGKIERAASEAGRSLSGEIQSRLADYELVECLLDDRVLFKIAVDLETLRKRARTSPASSISDEETAPLERAVVTAACIAELFQTVAKHAGHKLAEKRAKKMTDGWTQRIESGDLAAEFDIPATAERFSTGLTDLAIQEGERMAAHMKAAIGPSIWDVCFNKDSPLRSAAPGMGHGLMQTLRGSYVGLPPSFLPPPQTEKERRAFAKKMKTAGAIRDAAKHQISEGQHPGLSEDEVVDMLYNKLMTFDMNPNKAGTNGAPG